MFVFRCVPVLRLIGIILLCGSVVRAESWKTEISSLLNNHCNDCHAGKDAEAGIDLVSLSDRLEDAQVMQQWVRIHDKIKSGEMPPEDGEPIEDKDRSKILRLLSSEMTLADRLNNEVVLRRLNRVEYENTIRDLFGVHISLKQMLPEETQANGFDNVGAALSSSAELISAYLKAADVAIDAVYGPGKEPKRIKLSFNLKDHPRMKRLEGKLFRKTEDGIAIFGKSGQRVAQFWELIQTKREPGTYRVQMKVRTFQSDQPVALHVYGGDVLVGARPIYIVGYYDIQPGKEEVISFEGRLGRWDSFVVTPYGKDLATSRRDADIFPGPGLHIGDIELEGPIEQWPPVSYRKLLGDVDDKNASLEDVKSILSRLLEKAFRRKTKADEVEPYLALVNNALNDKRSFKEALRLGIKAILCSPEFLFLEEPGRDKISNFAIASRLSYFLWSSMPDEELLQLASQGKLNELKILHQQVERMLEDPKSQAFVENFTGQWLKLREIDFTEPDKKLYPEFDEPLKVAMVKETELFFRKLLDENLSLMNFVDSDFIIINQRLARHYDIEGVRGQAFRTVKLPRGHVRGGVLTQASLMKVTANGTNTSPVLRGVWILENIMGTPAPPPPAVPAVEPDTRGAVTLREQLAKHRNVKSCASCHVKIDPPGFALESFDVIGGWRENYRSLGKGKRLNDVYIDKYAHVRVAYKIGLPVDASGQTPDGSHFENILGFKKLLMREKHQITKNLTERLLIYSMGRGLGFSDRPAVEKIVQKIAHNKYGFRTLVHEVVQSELFRKP